MKTIKWMLILLVLFFASNLLAFAGTPTVKIIDLNNKKECVLIKNEGKSAVNLAGWQLHDHNKKKSKVHKYTFNTLQLKPGEVIQVQSGISKKAQKADPQAAKLKNADHYIFWTSRKVWNDSFDVAYLLDNNGNIVDEKQNGGKAVKQKSKK
jgi:hypothetical protein